jgi:hypothetical protein
MALGPCGARLGDDLWPMDDPKEPSCRTCLAALARDHHVKCTVMGDPMTRRERRFQRQFDALERLIPAARTPLQSLRSNRWRLVRLPLALLLIVGGLVSFLPILGIWMLPLGLLLLAVDLPFLRGPISVAMIRARRLVRRWRRRWQNR